MGEPIIESGSSSVFQEKPKTYFSKDNPQSVSRTKQSFKNECDINKIMARADKRMKHHGVSIARNMRQPVYGDFSNVPDYSTMLNTVMKVQRSFNSLPAKVRARFENDPAKLVSFIDRPENQEEAVSLGLIPRDLSGLKYVNADGVDITDEIYQKRGFKINGVSVDRQGKPIVPPKTEVGSGEPSGG